MDQIPFDQLVAALKGKGPGDFINSATGGVMKGREMSLEEKKRAFLEKVQMSQLENEKATLEQNKRKGVFEAKNKALDDFRNIVAGLTGTETRDPATQKVTAYTPPKYDLPSAQDMTNKLFGSLNDYTGEAMEPPVLSARTGTKTPSGGGGAKDMTNKLLGGLGMLEEQIRAVGSAYSTTTEGRSRPAAWMMGNIAKVAAGAGVGENAKDIQAANNMLTTVAPQIIKDFGDAGNIPDDQIARVVAAIANPGMQLDARWQLFQNFLRTASGGIKIKNPGVFNDPAFQAKLREYDIDPASIGSQLNRGATVTKTVSPDKAPAVDAFDNALKLLEERKAKKGAR